MAVSGQHETTQRLCKVRSGLYREDLAVSGQPNAGSICHTLARLYREDLAVSGQRILSMEQFPYARRLYREDLAVSGQLAGDIDWSKLGLYREDLAVSGQRRAKNMSILKSVKIIPRGFGGIRTTRRKLERYELQRLYREDLAVSGQLESKLQRKNCEDYTERIWRYQDNSLGSPSKIKTSLIIPRGFGGIRTT